VIIGGGKKGVLPPILIIGGHVPGLAPEPTPMLECLHFILSAHSLGGTPTVNKC